MKISIVTVTYNSNKTIRDTILSVLNQTYTNIEYIIVDGSSVDGTVDIIKEFENFHKQLVWISEPDLGIYDAMNKGIMMSTGDVVGILNSDDFLINSNVISKIASCFDDSETEAVYGNVYYVDPIDINRIKRDYNSKKFSISMFKWGFMPPHATFYCKKELFYKYGFYNINYKISADFDLIMRFMFCNQVNTKYIPEYFVKMRNGGVSTKNLSSKITLNKEIVKSCYKNGVYTNMFMLSLKYLYKIFELR